MRRWLIALLCCPLLAQAAAPVARIQALLARPATLCGKFEQSKRLQGLKRPVQSSGRFCVVGERGVLWRTLAPFPGTLRLTRDEIVQMQGDRIAMRLDSRQEPAVKMINSVLFSLLGGDLSPLEKVFSSEGSVQGNAWQVTLIPREPGLAKVISKISLTGGAYVKELVIDEASGDMTTVHFSQFATGQTAMLPEEVKLFE